MHHLDTEGRQTELLEDHAGKSSESAIIPNLLAESIQLQLYQRLEPEPRLSMISLNVYRVVRVTGLLKHYALPYLNIQVKILCMSIYIVFE